MTDLAYKSDPAIKAKLVAAIEADHKADAILQGSFIDKDSDNPVGFTGCAVGCAVAAFRGVVNLDEWHQVLQDETNIPRQLNYVIDGTFENLNSDDAPQFALDVFNAIEPGADLSLVVSRLMLDVLDGEPYGLLRIDDLADDVRKAVQMVADCYRRRLAGDEPSEQDWQAAGDAAWAAYPQWIADKLIGHLKGAPVPAKAA